MTSLELFPVYSEKEEKLLDSDAGTFTNGLQPQERQPVFSSLQGERDAKLVVHVSLRVRYSIALKEGMVGFTHSKVVSRCHGTQESVLRR